MNYTPEQKASWDRAMEILKKNLDVPSYNAWFKTLSLYAIAGDRLIIVGQNSFSMEHMQRRYGTMLLSTIDMVYDKRYQLEFYTQEEIGKIKDKLALSSLNERYTFDNFVVGDSNNFAYAASLAVAESPSKVYNPLFIYGGVGLGKTHLMNAIGNYIMRTDPNANILLMTSEMITNELIEAIAKKRTADLRNKLRNVDVLMVDDIQFLSKTKSAQEEVFHTFNDLYGREKQIILSSDRAPKEIPEIEDRLRTRFEWGLIVDIQRPDFETRVAILKQKAEEESIDAPDDVLQYIARSVNSNIRELEGCLTSLHAHSNLMGRPITLELAQGALGHLVKDPGPHKVTAELVIEIVAHQSGYTIEEITGKRRSRDLSLPRQIAMYVCRELTDLSTTAIGQAFGGRDHTTVMHGCEKIAKDMEEDWRLKRKVEDIIRRVEKQ